MKILANKLLLASLGVICLSSAQATSKLTTTFPVTATVTNSCSAVTASALNFGTFDPLSGNAKSANTSINVTCTSGTPFSVMLDSGNNGRGGQRNLKQQGGDGILTYNLFSDSNQTTQWGDGRVGSAVQGNGTGQAVNLTVYGRIDGNQNNVAVGSYADTITVTVDY